MWNSSLPNFVYIPDDAYFVTASKCDSLSLCALDATCRSFRKLNHALGLWRNLGVQKFEGLEVDERGLFTDCNQGRSTTVSRFVNRTMNITNKPTPLGLRRRQMEPAFHIPQLPNMRERILEVNWKQRLALFSREVYEFRSPFDPLNISVVGSPDEVAYTKCRLRADILAANPNITIYLEIMVTENADNLSLAIVDFDEGGKSSVTFSPDTGAVIKETKIQEMPRRVKGAYIQPVKPNFAKFEGRVGLYVKHGLIAFFRQYAALPWESTGFCVDFSWARGQRLTPCLAFRDQGKYITRVTSVGKSPPFEPQVHEEAFNPSRWKELNWEGGPPMM